MEEKTKNQKVSARFKRYMAFTLAEVLIVLGIVGIIAEITIPTVINDIQTSKYKAAWKETFSILSQVGTMARTNDYVDLDYNNPAFTLVDYVIKYTKNTNYCNDSTCITNLANFANKTCANGAQLFIGPTPAVKKRRHFCRTGKWRNNTFCS